MVDRVFAPVQSSEQPPYRYQPWPAWRYAPDGRAEIFDRPEDVPEGWKTLDEYNGVPPKKSNAETAEDLDATLASEAQEPDGMERPRELTEEQRAELHAELMANNTQSALAAILFQMSGPDETIEFLPSWPKAKLVDTIIDNGGPPAMAE